MESTEFDRRKFLGRAVGAGAALTLGSLAAPRQAAAAQTESGKRVRVAVIGCGSVSNRYLPELAACPWAELVSTCDIIPDRAEKQAKEFKVPHYFPHISKLLAGPDFDLMVNLTD